MLPYFAGDSELQLSKTCIPTSPTAWIFKEYELPSSNWQFPKSQQLELWIEETDLVFSWYTHVFSSSLSCLPCADCGGGSCCSSMLKSLFPPMHAMCAWEGVWWAGGDDTAMCYKDIHRLQSQEGGLQQSNLTSYIMFFCTCVKFLERKHPISVEAFILLAMLFRSSQYQGPNFSWDYKTLMCWSRRKVLGSWIIKKCAHHQWLDSSLGSYICLWTLRDLWNWKVFLQVSWHFALIFSALL